MLEGRIGGKGVGTRRDGEEGPLGKDTERGGWDAEGSSVKILLDAGIFFTIQFLL